MISFRTDFVDCPRYIFIILQSWIVTNILNISGAKLQSNTEKTLGLCWISFSIFDFTTQVLIKIIYLLLLCNTSPETFGVTKSTLRQIYPDIAI